MRKKGAVTRNEHVEMQYNFNNLLKSQHLNVCELQLNSSSKGLHKDTTRIAVFWFLWIMPVS